MWALEAPPGESAGGLAEAAETTCLGVIHLVQALALAQSPLWGLGRTIVYEHPEFDCTLVDLAAAGAAGEAQAAEAAAITMTGTSSKDNHRRRIHDLRTRSGA